MYLITLGANNEAVEAIQISTTVLLLWPATHRLGIAAARRLMTVATCLSSALGMCHLAMLSCGRTKMLMRRLSVSHAATHCQMDTVSS